MGLLTDRTILVTGVLTSSSIAHACARVAQEEGATVVLSSFGRATATTRRAAAKLPVAAPVVELDLTSDAANIRIRITGIEGLVNSLRPRT